MKPTIRKLTKQLMQGIDTRSDLRSEINQIKNTRECAFCPYPNFNFRDELSRKEYEISALCMDCQDEMFGKGGNN
tara:strand:- start:207 stop:431 length:225 start_codon:yes stop_codon:yes gene_type:complete